MNIVKEKTCLNMRRSEPSGMQIIIDPIIWNATKNNINSQSEN